MSDSMLHFRSFFLMLLLASTLHSASMADVEIRQVVPATAIQRQVMAEAIKKAPPRDLGVELLREADKVLLDEEPKPFDKIFYEGLLNTDPRRVASERALADMDKLAALCEAFAVSEQPRYATKAREYILAWVRTYVPTGNTINENKLEPVLWGFDLLRDRFTAEEQHLIELWLSQIAEKQIALYRHRTPEAGIFELHNWDSKRYKIVGIIGRILGNKEWVQYGIDGYKVFLAHGLFADGSSVDLKTRDALSYHVAALRPLLVLALWEESKTPGAGRKLLDLEAASGASLRKSIEFVVPYAMGERQREEWRNSKVLLDQKRAAAGIAEYQPGKLYDPLSSLEMFQLATLLDSKYLPVTQVLTARKGSPHPWLSLLIGTATRH